MTHSTSATWARSRRARGAVAALAVTSAVSALAACSANPSRGDDEGSGADFYKGKTITYVAGAPGTPTAEQIVAMKSVMEKALGATINIRYNTDASSVGYNQVATAKADGLTLGAISPLVAVGSYASGSDHGGIGFDLSDVSYIGAVDNPASLVVACKGSPYTSFDDIVNASDQVDVLAIPSGPATELPHLLMAGYDVDAKYISGYVPATLVQGCQRGDGDVAALGASNFVDASGTKMVTGATPLLLSGPIPDGSPNAFLNDEVPTVADYEAQHAPSSDGQEAVDLAAKNYTSDVPEIATFGPKGIPQDRVDALEAAMKKAAEDKGVQTALAKVSIPPGFTDGADTLAFVKKTTDDEQTVLQYMK